MNKSVDLSVFASLIYYYFLLLFFYFRTGSSPRVIAPRNFTCTAIPAALWQVRWDSAGARG